MSRSESGLEVQSLAAGLSMAANSDSRLILLVGKSAGGLRTAAATAAIELGWRMVDLNIELAQRLLPFTAQERRDEAWEALEEVVGDQNDGVVLCGTDILFEPSLGYRPYEALRRLGRRGPIVASWFGTVDGGEIGRAQQGHPEYVQTGLDVPFMTVAEPRGAGG